MIIPSSKYPSQTDTDANYPQGKARNVTASGDTTGTPFEKDWVNDVWGFFQALMLETGISPSGSPDSATSSQIRDAVRALKRKLALYTFSNAATNIATAFGLTLSYQFGGYSLASNAVTVPEVGQYRVAVGGRIQGTAVTNPCPIDGNVTVGGTSVLSFGVKRPSAIPSDDFSVFAQTVVNVTAPGSQAIAVLSQTASAIWTLGTGSNLLIERVG